MFLVDTLAHANSTCRADEAAEVTAHALGSHQTGTARQTVEDDGLVASVTTRHLAASATHTEILVELRIDDGVAVETVGLEERRG